MYNIIQGKALPLKILNTLKIRILICQFNIDRKRLLTRDFN
ncbi:hypothetical protein GRFL_0562 [Christiangramia flava JLT2011]|uniref:Uncharacterized protein n=1 Tax=Christiangramia flava JLT2011 TaxID=1229726 RepID=A0A1L7I102_9FLAO|nr:hypothetical protein GRFL_0562 [Christiangramia flava JLT2011]